MHAFGEFRDVLAREMASALPELRDDVERVVRETGGRPLAEVNGAEGMGK
jgi:mediator of RNA polymerase II transcription subunit 10